MNSFQAVFLRTLLIQNVHSVRNWQLAGPFNNLSGSGFYGFFYIVGDQVSEFGTLNAFKINCHDIVTTIDKFPSGKRTSPVSRRFSNSRQQYYPPEDYDGLRSFFKKIVKTEQKLIGYE